MTDKTTASTEFATPDTNKLDFWVHKVFPARTLIKDAIYWVAELIAALFFLIWLFQMDLIEFPFKMDATKKAWAYNVKIDPTITNPSMDQKEPTRLEMREYGWICLCYFVKHVIYIIDTILLLSKKYAMALDIIAPVVNAIMWGAWTLYGFLFTGWEVQSGYMYNSQQTKCYNRIEKDKMDGKTPVEFDVCMTDAKEFYKTHATFVWLWLFPAAACIINLLLWIFNGIKNRSSAFSCVALSTWLIPLQLWWLHFWMKGWWFVKMTPVPAKDAPQPTLDEIWNDMISSEYAGARSTFPIIYYGSYVGILFALFCIFRAIKGKAASALDLIKWLLYALLWIAIFIWCLFLDATLFH